jgi:hypothetical protein
VYWLDDDRAELAWQFGELLAAWADNDGYMGFWREADFDETVTVLIARDGKLHIPERQRS